MVGAVRFEPNQIFRVHSCPFTILREDRHLVRITVFPHMSFSRTNAKLSC